MICKLIRNNIRMNSTIDLVTSIFAIKFRAPTPPEGCAIFLQERLVQIINVCNYSRQHNYMLSPFRLSFCLWHGRISQKRLRLWIMQFSPYNSPIPLVFREQVSSRNFEGFPQSGGVKWGWGMQHGWFSAFKLPPPKWCKIWLGLSLMLSLITNRNVYTRSRLVPKSMTFGWPWTNKRPFSHHCIFRNGDFQPLGKNMSQTISNIRPRIPLTINRRSTGSIDQLRIICQGSLYTHCCRASPLLQLGFLVILAFA